MATALAFPNPSRSFDERRKGVRFMGYDDMIQVPFIVEAGALSVLGGAAKTETECLAAFDAATAAIHKVARRAYIRGQTEIYTLTAADF